MKFWQTIGHIHGDIRLEGLGLFLVFGDEKDAQETEGRSVQSTKWSVTAFTLQLTTIFIIDKSDNNNDYSISL